VAKFRRGRDWLKVRKALIMKYSLMAFDTSEQITHLTAISLGYDFQASMAVKGNFSLLKLMIERRK